MNIRTAKAADIPGMLSLLTQVCNVHQAIRPDIFIRDGVKYDAAALAELLKDPEKPIFVAMEGDFLKGYCFCVLEEIKNDPVLQDVKSLYIDDLCVDETIRGRHVGSRLYDHVCAYAKSIGCRSVTLNVWCGNDSAMAFYNSRGMKPRKIYMETTL